MSDFDKNRSHTEQEPEGAAEDPRMLEATRKFTKKPKVIDIFSNTDQKPRLKNQNPLEADPVRGTGRKKN